MSRPAIDARGLAHAYGSREVLREVELRVDEGELVAVVGPNGAGKSTLLRLLLGFMPLSTGSVQLAGRPIADLGRREVAKLAAFVPQGFAAEPGFSVREMVAMGRVPHLGRFQSEGDGDRKAVRDAIEAADLSGMEARPFNELSGGERQRVVLARALAQDTPVLMLDEPTTSLDLLHAFGILQVVRNAVDGGRAALLAVHDLSLAARFADRLLVLHEGRVAAGGRPRDVLTAELLARVFGVRAEVIEREEGLLLDVLGRV